MRIAATTGRRLLLPACFNKKTWFLLLFLCLIGIYLFSSASLLRMAGNSHPELQLSIPADVVGLEHPKKKDHLILQRQEPNGAPTTTTTRLNAYLDNVNATNNQVLPDWINEYFDWHKRQQQLLMSTRIPEGIQNVRFLLMECWPWNPVCGGTADRLRPIPFTILVAHQTKRLLLIKWGRPAELEEFLVPPKGGLDWRVPHWLIPHLANQSNHPPATSVDRLVQLAQLQDERVITSRLQAHDYGSKYYNSQCHYQTGEPLLRDVYRFIWNKVCVPTPPIAALIEQQLEELHLVPGQYAAAHVRALYVGQDRKPQQLQSWAENAINCASMLQPGLPILFASDSTYATQMALEYGKTRRKRAGTGAAVVARTTAMTAQPLHLDKAVANTTTTTTTDSTPPPEHFYDTFVDLYLLGMSQCLTYNIGGYGKWGLMLGYNSSCGMRHQKGYGFKRDGVTSCRWMDANS